MSRTYKDRYYCAYFWNQVREGKVKEPAANYYGVDASNRRRVVFKQTNKRMRKYKGFIASGGAYRKMFADIWDVW